MGHVQIEEGGGGAGPLFGGIIEGIVGSSTKQKEPFNPFDIPKLDIVSARDQARVEAIIAAAIAAGQEPTVADLANLQQIKDFRAAQNRRFNLQKELFPLEFLKFGIPLTATLQNVFDFLGSLTPLGQIPHPTVALPGGATGDRGFAPHLPGATGGVAGTGARLPAFRTAGAPTKPTSAQQSAGLKFIKCLIQSVLPTRTGGTKMPFVTTAGFAPSPGSLDFGGFGGIIQSGLNLATSLFSKPQSPSSRFPGLQPAGFFGPLVAPAARALGPIAAGAFGGTLAEGFFGLGGGADTLDETAAFTDPVPGACRPKSHVKVNPCTGKGVWFVPRGKPLVFSGDMAACKRVDRVAKRLDKARPKRRAHHHHPR